MVTKKELEWIQFYACWVGRVHVHGFEWNSHTKTFSATKRKWKIATNCFYIGWHAFVCIFSISRLYSSIKAEETEPFHLAVCFFSAMSETAVFICHSPVAFTRKKLANLLGQLVAFNAKPGRLTTPTKREKVINFLEKFYLTASPPGVIIMTIAECLAFHGEGTLWTPFGLFVTFIHVPLSTSAATLIFGLMQMYLVIFFVTVFDTLPRLDEEEFTDDFIDETLKDYRSLSILCNRFNDAVGLLLVPGVKIAAGVGGLSFMYMGIRAARRFEVGAASVVSLPLFIFIGLYLVAIITLAASTMSSLWTVSNRFLLKMADLNRELQGVCPISRKVRAATLKSFLPLRLYVGRLYFMEREAKLTFLQFLATALVNMLLLT